MIQILQKKHRDYNRRLADLSGRVNKRERL